MKALVTGASGMLGVQVARAAALQWGRENVVALTHSQLDITSKAAVERAFDAYRPDVVFNCAGIVRPRAVSDERYLAVNGTGPFNLAHYADVSGAKVVQISTDCVFKGDAGPYDESRTPDATDIYGRSKMMGELKYGKHLTVRTSFIGIGKRGLLHWLLSQKGYVQGYRRVLWNGLTAPCAARRIVDSVCHTGLLHLYGEDVTKHHLLTVANEVFGLGLSIEPVDEPASDLRLRTAFSANGHAPALREQLEELRRYL